MEQNITRLDKGEGRKAQDGRKNLRKEFCCDTFRYDSHDICLRFFFLISDYGSMSSLASGLFGYLLGHGWVQG